MKKLISVFAALALVGSLAAQKKKPAAKAPAKPAPAAPVVAAPAAPVVAAPAMPASGAAAAGMGLFVDLRGSYTLANGTSTSASDGFSQTAGNSDKQTYKTSASAAIGGGLTLGYEISKGLAVVGSYDIRSFSTREFKSATTGGASTDYTYKQTWTNMVLGLGLRPSVSALGGEVYGGGGLAVVLPFETTATTNYSNSSAGFNGATGNRTKQEEVKGYNLGLGAYGEVGYKYYFTENIGLVIGVRVVVATVNNIDKTKVVTNTDSTPDTATTTYKDSYSTQDNTDEAAKGTANATRALSNFETLGVTDISGNVGIALRF